MREQTSETMKTREEVSPRLSVPALCPHILQDTPIPHFPNFPVVTSDLILAKRTQERICYHDFIFLIKVTDVASFTTFPDLPGALNTKMDAAVAALRG